MPGVRGGPVWTHSFNAGSFSLAEAGNVSDDKAEFS